MDMPLALRSDETFVQCSDLIQPPATQSFAEVATVALNVDVFDADYEDSFDQAMDEAIDELLAMADAAWAEFDAGKSINLP